MAMQPDRRLPLQMAHDPGPVARGVSRGQDASLMRELGPRASCATWLPVIDVVFVNAA